MFKWYRCSRTQVFHILRDKYVVTGTRVCIWYPIKLVNTNYYYALRSFFLFQLMKMIQLLHHVFLKINSDVSYTSTFVSTKKHESYILMIVNLTKIDMHISMFESMNVQCIIHSTYTVICTCMSKEDGNLGPNRFYYQTLARRY